MLCQIVLYVCTCVCVGLIVFGTNCLKFVFHLYSYLPKSWSLQRTEGPREELHLFHDFVSCVVFSPNGKRVIAAADNGIVVSQ